MSSNDGDKMPYDWNEERDSTFLPKDKQSNPEDQLKKSAESNIIKVNAPTEKPPTAEAKNVALEKPRELTPEEKEELRKKKEHADYIEKLKKETEYEHLPKDPIYRPIPDDLIELNNLDKNMDDTTKIMINVALSDYVVFRKIEDNEDDVENVKVNFKRVNFDDYSKYSDVQEELDYLNNKQAILRGKVRTNPDLYDEIRELQKSIKKVIEQKINTGLEVFFKKHSQYDLVKDRKLFDYNDLLFNIEIAFFRYTRSPFLRRISLRNTS